MSEVLLSVIIPTKNRHKVLIPTIKTLSKNISDSRVEFVIQDNSNDNIEMLEYQKQANDSRIRYFYDSEDIGLKKNFDYALIHSCGKYLILIGDDDLVNPYIMDVLDHAVKSEIECLIYPRATYYWPDVVFQKEVEFFAPASIQIIKNADLNIQKLSSAEELQYVLSMGGIYLYKLPALYHGIVKKEIVDAIYKKHGTYILGPSPDICLAISLAFELDFYHYINFPVSIAGASYDSAAGMGRRGEHSAALENAPKWLPKDTIANWDIKIPRLWNGFTVYAQSIFIVFKHNNRVLNLNYFKLYDKILYGNFKDIIFLKKTFSFKSLDFLRKNWMIIKNRALNIIKAFVLSLPDFMFSFIIKRYGYFADLKHIKNIDNVESCMQWLKAEYKNKFRA